MITLGKIMKVTKGLLRRLKKLKSNMKKRGKAFYACKTRITNNRNDMLITNRTSDVLESF